MKELLCISCPNGCRLSVEGSGDNISVSGNRCKKGVPFAQTELTNPVRTLTTTVRTAFSEVPVLPVRTSAEIPRGKIPEIMDCINNSVVEKPLAIGDIVIENVLGLGVHIIATSNILMEAG
jgi:CxxC motif-containing protein